MSQVTDGWSQEERDTFCALLTRFNSSLADRQAAHHPPQSD